MQHEVVKLNTLISKNSGFKDDLESNNELMETEFLRRLKDEELESIQVQTRVEELIDERARIEQDVVDAEREILEWEKRIQLAQEMKESLMGDEDSNELAAMKKEIHRMRLRLDQLSRQREVLITSMERSVDRRGDIHTKSQAASKTKGSANHNMVKKEIIDLQKRIKRSTKDADHAEANVDAAAEEIETLQSYVEQERAEVQHFEDELQDLSVELDVKSRERTQNRDRIMEDQYLYKHLSAAKEKKKTYKKSAEQYDTDIAGHYNTLKDLNNVAAYVAEEQPVAAQALGAVQASIEHKLESQPRSKA
jgi:chromosome segregation ATPase